MVCVLIGQCCASDDARLATIRASKMAELLHSGRFGLPKSLKSDRDVYLLITSQPMGDTVFLGSWPSVSESKLSDDLAWVVKGCFTGAPDFDYFHDYDNTIVSAIYPVSKSMVGNWSDTIPVSKFIQNVKARGLIPHVLFRIRSYAEASELGDPMYRSARYLYFNQDQLSKLDDVHVSATSPITFLLIIIIALLLIPVFSVWSLSVGIRMMGDASRSIEQRQAMYRRFCVLGVLLLMMCHQVWVYFFLLSQHIAPGIELWIRSEPAVVLVLTEMASILLLAALLITGWMTKRALLPYDKSKPLEIGSAFLICLAIIFMIFQQIILSLLRTTKSLEFSLRMFFFALFFFVSTLVIWLFSIWWAHIKLSLSDIDYELTTRAKEIAIRMGRIVGDVRIDNSDNGRKFSNAMIHTRSRHIIFAHRNLEVLGTEEIDWILAHEIAHYDYRKSPLFIVLLLSLSTVTFAMFTGDMIMKICSLAPVTVFIILVSVIMPGISHKREFEADRIALETTRNLPAAESALSRFIEASQNPESMRKDTSTHPSLEKRIQALRETALRLGLDVPKDDA